MKKIAGSLKLDLAAYSRTGGVCAARDRAGQGDAKATRSWRAARRAAQQPQYKPMSVEQEIIVVYAGTQGFLDDVPVNGVRSFRMRCCSTSTRARRTCGASLAEKKELSVELETRLKQRWLISGEGLEGLAKPEAPPSNLASKRGLGGSRGPGAVPRSVPAENDRTSPRPHPGRVRTFVQGSTLKLRQKCFHENERGQRPAGPGVNTPNPDETHADRGAVARRAFRIPCGCAARPHPGSA